MTKAQLIAECEEKSRKIEILESMLAKKNSSPARGEPSEEKDENDENRLIAIYKETIARQSDELERKEAIMNKNSANSSIPTSKEGFNAPPRTVSTRVKTGKKAGGQPGHPGRALEYFDNPTEIVELPKEDVCPLCGSKTVAMREIVKQRVDVRVVVDIIEEHSFETKCFHCRSTARTKSPDGFVQKVQYGNSIKTLAIFLSAFCNVAIDKIVQFFKDSTGGSIKISHGEIICILEEFSDKCLPFCDRIKTIMLQSPALGADETSWKIEGKIKWIQIFATKLFTLAIPSSIRSGFGDFDLEGKGVSMLVDYIGVVVHDHLKSYYNYVKALHAECNAHILRILPSMTESLKHPWAAKMSDFLRSAYHRKKELIAKGEIEMREEEIDDLFELYDEIIKSGEEQHEISAEDRKPAWAFDEERRLLARMKEYKACHLRFITNFDVPFDNNDSERGVRFLKSKLRSCYGFRSRDFASKYAIIASILMSANKQGMSVMHVIRRIMDSAAVDEIFPLSGKSGD